MHKAITAVFFSALLAFGGASTTAPPVKKAPGNFSAGDDKQIETKIREKLAKSKIGADGFKVRVQGGIATWEGKTSVIQHKGAATRMAKTAGAKAVVNHIEIDENARKKASETFNNAPKKAELKRSDPRDQR